MYHGKGSPKRHGKCPQRGLPAAAGTGQARQRQGQGCSAPRRPELLPGRPASSSVPRMEQIRSGWPSPGGTGEAGPALCVPRTRMARNCRGLGQGEVRPSALFLRAWGQRCGIKGGRWTKAREEPDRATGAGTPGACAGTGFTGIRALWEDPDIQHARGTGRVSLSVPSGASARWGRGRQFTQKLFVSAGHLPAAAACALRSHGNVPGPREARGSNRSGNLAESLRRSTVGRKGREEVRWRQLEGYLERKLWSEPKGRNRGT